MEQAQEKWVDPNPKVERTIATAESAVREVCRQYRLDMMKAGRRADPASAAHHLTGAASLAGLQGYHTMAEAFRQAAVWIAQQKDAVAALKSVAEGS